MASDKKEKKEKKHSGGVEKVKKDKKEKRVEKEKLKQKIAETLDNQLQADAAASSKVDDDDHPGSDFEDVKNADIQTQIVYFAVPLADAKGHKKIYKTIKKGMLPFLCRPPCGLWILARGASGPARLC